MHDEGGDETRQDPHRDSYLEELDSQRLKARITAVLGRMPKPVAVQRPDGTVFLKGRRRTDRSPGAADRRDRDRRKPVS